MEREVLVRRLGGRGEMIWARAQGGERERERERKVKRETFFN